MLPIRTSNDASNSYPRFSFFRHPKIIYVGCSFDIKADGKDLEVYHVGISSKGEDDEDDTTFDGPVSPGFG